MGSIPWVSMMSRRDREKKERKYKEQMFPFGEPQRDWEQVILKELFPQVKDGDQLLYQLLCAKECLLEEDPDWREEGLAKWLNSSLMQRFSAEDDDPGVSLVRTGARQPGGVPGPGAGAKEGSRA